MEAMGPGKGKAMNLSGSDIVIDTWDKEDATEK